METSPLPSGHGHVVVVLVVVRVGDVHVVVIVVVVIIVIVVVVLVVVDVVGSVDDGVDERENECEVSKRGHLSGRFTRFARAVRQKYHRLLFPVMKANKNKSNQHLFTTTATTSTTITATTKLWPVYLTF